MQYSLEIKKFNYSMNKETIFSSLNLKLQRGTINYIINDIASSHILFQALLNLTDSNIKAYLFNNPIENSLEEIGYYNPNYSIYNNLTIKDFINLSNAYYENDYIDNALSLVSKFNLDLNKQIKDLSKEEYELVKLVDILYHEPSLAMLESPDLYLNQDNQNILNDYLISLKDKGKTILISSTKLSLYSHTTNIYMFYLKKLMSLNELKIKKYIIKTKDEINTLKLKLLETNKDADLTQLTYIGNLLPVLDEFNKRKISFEDIIVGEVL